MTRARWAAAAAVMVAAALAGACRARSTPSSAPAVLVASDERRLRRSDAALARDEDRRLRASRDAEVALIALRGETVALQVVLVAGERPLQAATVAVEGLDGGAAGPLASVWRQHYLAVRTRSREGDDARSSLGWLPGARPPNGEVMGDVPDALLPASAGDAAAAVPAGQTGAFWVDVAVPETAAPGSYRGTLVASGGGAALARLPLRIDVRGPALPYRAASVFVYYEAERLAARMGPRPDDERHLWQLLHAHHVDALASLRDGADVERLRAAYDGSWFTPAAGYHGPGIGRPPAVIALGAYGVLGDPSAGALARVDRMLAALPPAAAREADLFLYAVDEECRSPRAADWKRALAGRPTLAVAHTCEDPPDRQAADVVMISGGGFARATPAAARAAGKRAWAYNGRLPQSGTLLLDADPRGLTANGWIAAAAGIERWFYWESIFWDDDNRGGRGPVDPFTTAETFHNSSGDAGLGDGILLYPGRQQGRFAASSPEREGVLPSLRLRAIRRGVEDAGLIALAARARPDETARIVARAVPAFLDGAPAGGRASWEGGPRFDDARTALRALIPPGAPPLAPAELRAVLADLAARRPVR